MELFTFSTFTALLVGVITFSVIRLWQGLRYQQTYWKQKKVPSYYALPFTGVALKLLLRMITFMEYSDFLYSLHPKARYVGMMDMSTPIVIMRDPELIKEITVKSFEHFPNHRPFVDVEADPLFGKNIFLLKGDRWRTMRNTLTPSFTANKMRFLCDLVSKTSEKFVGYLAEHPEMTSDLELKDAISRYTNDVTATAAFGININSVEDRKNEFYTRGLEIVKFGGLLGTVKMILMRIFPWLARITGIKLFSDRTVKFFRGIIAETVRVRTEQGIIRPDMIHLLMQAKDKDTSLNGEITIDDIVAQAFGFFLAGFDTTSSFMCCLVHELAINPDIQERLCEEIDRLIAESNGELTYETLSKMEYLEMVMSETLRRYPPLVFIDRVCSKGMTLPSALPNGPDATIDPETVIMFPVYSMHNDPKLFPNPEKFDPERFSEKNKEKMIPYSYLPFGAGPRKCIANRFVLMEAKLLIVHLLRTFHVKRTEKTVHPIVFSKKSFAPMAEKGYWIRLEKKEKTS